MAHGEVAGQIALEGDELLVRKERGLWSDAWRRLFKNKAATLALFILTAIVVVTLAVNLVPGLLPHSTTYQDYDALFQDPNSDHWFGTDNLGRDLFARVMQGLFISLMVGFGVQVFVIGMGVTVGGLAALGGRTMDNVMMRFTDIAYAFPDLLFIILLRSVMTGKNIPVINGFYEDVLLDDLCDRLRRVGHRCPADPRSDAVAFPARLCDRGRSDGRNEAANRLQAHAT